MNTAMSYLVVPLMALCGAAAAQETSQETAASSAPAAQGLTVVRDAETGKPRAPTPAEMQALLGQPAAAARRQPAAAARRQPAPAVVTGRHGESRVHLGERKLVYSVVRRDAGGKLDHHCVDGSAAADRIIAPSAPAAAQGETSHEHR